MAPRRAGRPSAGSITTGTPSSRTVIADRSSHKFVPSWEQKNPGVDNPRVLTCAVLGSGGGI
jgi:hypothetical protein